MAAKVIATATDKGGAGKTTLTMNLAAYWSTVEHRRVLLIDCDPTRVLERWHARGPLKEIPLLGNIDAHTITSAIDDNLDAYDVILVDCAGSEGQVELFAFGCANLVLIPAKAAEPDIAAAARTHLKVKETEKMMNARLRGRDTFTIDTRIVLTMVSKSTTVARHADKLIRAQPGLIPLGTLLRNLVAFSESTFRGSTPTLDEPAGAAAYDIRRLAREVGHLVGLPDFQAAAAPAPATAAS